MISILFIREKKENTYNFWKQKLKRGKYKRKKINYNIIINFFLIIIKNIYIYNIIIIN